MGYHARPDVPVPDRDVRALLREPQPLLALAQGHLGLEDMGDIARRDDHLRNRSPRIPQRHDQSMVGTDRPVDRALVDRRTRLSRRKGVVYGVRERGDPVEVEPTLRPRAAENVLRGDSGGRDERRVHVDVPVVAVVNRDRVRDRVEDRGEPVPLGLDLPGEPFTLGRVLLPPGDVLGDDEERVPAERQEGAGPPLLAVRADHLNLARDRRAGHDHLQALPDKRLHCGYWTPELAPQAADQHLERLSGIGGELLVRPDEPFVRVPEGDTVRQGAEDRVEELAVSAGIGGDGG